MESETCCKFGGESELYDESIVIESNDVAKTVVNRKCGQRNVAGMQSRISDGETAEYGKECSKAQTDPKILGLTIAIFPIQLNFRG